MDAPLSQETLPETCDAKHSSSMSAATLHLSSIPVPTSRVASVPASPTATPSQPTALPCDKKDVSVQPASSVCTIGKLPSSTSRHKLLNRPATSRFKIYPTSKKKQPMDASARLRKDSMRTSTPLPLSQQRHLREKCEERTRFDLIIAALKADVAKKTREISDLQSCNTENVRVLWDLKNHNKALQTLLHNAKRVPAKLTRDLSEPLALASSKPPLETPFFPLTTTNTLQHPHSFTPLYSHKDRECLGDEVLKALQSVTQFHPFITPVKEWYESALHVWNRLGHVFEHINLPPKPTRTIILSTVSHLMEERQAVQKVFKDLYSHELRIIKKITEFPKEYQVLYENCHAMCERYKTSQKALQDELHGVATSLEELKKEYNRTRERFYMCAEDCHGYQRICRAHSLKLRMYKEQHVQMVFDMTEKCRKLKRTNEAIPPKDLQTAYAALQHVLDDMSNALDVSERDRGLLYTALEDVAAWRSSRRWTRALRVKVSRDTRATSLRRDGTRLNSHLPRTAVVLARSPVLHVTFHLKATPDNPWEQAEPAVSMRQQTWDASDPLAVYVQPTDAARANPLLPTKYLCEDAATTCDVQPLHPFRESTSSFCTVSPLHTVWHHPPFSPPSDVPRVGTRRWERTQTVGLYTRDKVPRSSQTMLIDAMETPLDERVVPASDLQRKSSFLKATQHARDRSKEQRRHAVHIKVGHPPSSMTSRTSFSVIAKKKRLLRSSRDMLSYAKQRGLPLDPLETMPRVPTTHPPPLVQKQKRLLERPKKKTVTAPNHTTFPKTTPLPPAFSTEWPNENSQTLSSSIPTFRPRISPSMNVATFSDRSIKQEDSAEHHLENPETHRGVVPWKPQNEQRHGQLLDHFNTLQQSSLSELSRLSSSYSSLLEKIELVIANQMTLKERVDHQNNWVLNEARPSASALIEQLRTQHSIMLDAIQTSHAEQVVLLKEANYIKDGHSSSCPVASEKPCSLCAQHQVDIEKIKSDYATKMHEQWLILEKCISEGNRKESHPTGYCRSSSYPMVGYTDVLPCYPLLSDQEKNDYRVEITKIKGQLEAEKLENILLHEKLEKNILEWGELKNTSPRCKAKHSSILVNKSVQTQTLEPFNPLYVHRKVKQWDRYRAVAVSTMATRQESCSVSDFSNSSSESYAHMKKNKHLKLFRNSLPMTTSPEPFLPHTLFDSSTLQNKYRSQSFQQQSSQPTYASQGPVHRTLPLTVQRPLPSIAAPVASFSRRPAVHPRPQFPVLASHTVVQPPCATPVQHLFDGISKNASVLTLKEHSKEPSEKVFEQSEEISHNNIFDSTSEFVSNELPTKLENAVSKQMFQKVSTKRHGKASKENVGKYLDYTTLLSYQEAATESLKVVSEELSETLSEESSRRISDESSKGCDEESSKQVSDKLSPASDKSIYNDTSTALYKQPLKKKFETTRKGTFEAFQQKALKRPIIPLSLEGHKISLKMQSLKHLIQPSKQDMTHHRKELLIQRSTQFLDPKAKPFIDSAILESQTSLQLTSQNPKSNALNFETRQPLNKESPPLSPEPRIRLLKKGSNASVSEVINVSSTLFPLDSSHTTIAQRSRKRFTLVRKEKLVVSTLGRSISPLTKTSLAVSTKHIAQPSIRLSAQRSNLTSEQVTKEPSSRSRSKLIPQPLLQVPSETINDSSLDPLSPRSTVAPAQRSSSAWENNLLRSSRETPPNAITEGVLGSLTEKSVKSATRRSVGSQRGVLPTPTERSVQPLSGRTFQYVTRKSLPSYTENHLQPSSISSSEPVSSTSSFLYIPTASHRFPPSFTPGTRSLSLQSVYSHGDSSIEDSSVNVPQDGAGNCQELVDELVTLRRTVHSAFLTTKSSSVFPKTYTRDQTHFI